WIASTDVQTEARMFNPTLSIFTSDQPNWKGNGRIVNIPHDAVHAVALVSSAAAAESLLIIDRLQDDVIVSRQAFEGAGLGAGVERSLAAVSGPRGTLMARGQGLSPP